MTGIYGYAENESEFQTKSTQEFGWWGGCRCASVGAFLSLSLSLTKPRLTKIHRDRQWVQRDSSRRTKWRRKERRRNGRRTPRRMQVRIVRKTVMKRRSLRRDVGRDASLRHLGRYWSSSCVLSINIWMAVLYFYINHEHNHCGPVPSPFNKNECASIIPWRWDALQISTHRNHTSCTQNTNRTPSFKKNLFFWWVDS